MCRNIKVLFNFEPPATSTEIQAAAEQYIRKISGFTSPSAANRKSCDKAILEVVRASTTLLNSLVTNAPPRDRSLEAEKAHLRAIARFGK